MRLLILLVPASILAGAAGQTVTAVLTDVANVIGGLA